jgi:hypothetical protein
LTPFHVRRVVRLILPAKVLLPSSSRLETFSSAILDEIDLLMANLGGSRGPPGRQPPFGF